MTATRRARSIFGHLDPIAAKGRTEIRKRAPKTLHGATPGDVRIDVARVDVVHDPAGCLAAYCLAVPAMPLDLDNDPLIMTVGEPCAVVIHCSKIQDVVELQHVGRAWVLHVAGN